MPNGKKPRICQPVAILWFSSGGPVGSRGLSIAQDGNGDPAIVDQSYNFVYAMLGVNMDNGCRAVCSV